MTPTENKGTNGSVSWRWLAVTAMSILLSSGGFVSWILFAKQDAHESAPGHREQVMHNRVIENKIEDTRADVANIKDTVDKIKDDLTQQRFDIKIIKNVVENSHKEN